MPAPRTTFRPRLANLGFSLEAPPGFVEVPVPAEDVDFSDITKNAALAILSSPVALALVTVAARPAYGDGSVTQWIAFLLEHCGVTVTSAISGFCGGPAHLHPIMLVEAEQEQEGTHLTIRVIALEDAQRFVTVTAMCPTALWASYGGQLEGALLSFELESPQGPTVPCVPNGPVPIVDMPGMVPGDWPRGRGTLEVDDGSYERAREAARAAAVESANVLVRQGRFDDAEMHVRNADADIHGMVAIARMFEERLRELVASNANREECHAVHERALRWALRAYPEPHTAVEADDYEAGRAIDRARLDNILHSNAGGAR